MTSPVDQAAAAQQMIAMMADAGLIAAINDPDEDGVVSLTFASATEADDLALGRVGDLLADAALAHRGLES